MQSSTYIYHGNAVIWGKEPPTSGFPPNSRPSRKAAEILRVGDCQQLQLKPHDACVEVTTYSTLNIIRQPGERPVLRRCTGQC